MQKVSLKKIKSAPKSPLIYIGWGAVAAVIAAVILAIIFFIVLFIFRHNSTRNPYILHTTKQDYTLEAASTIAEQEKGLGGRSSMPLDHGMLFVFSSEAQHCFWMKDTRFALDMIWADGAKNVTAIEQNVTPSTYPRTFCHQGKYAIELNAGVASSNKLMPGQRLNF